MLHISNKDGSFSKTTNITKVCKSHFAESALGALKPFNKGYKADAWYPGISILGISASKFFDLDKNGKPVKPAPKSSRLLKMFNNATAKSEVVANDTVTPKALTSSGVLIEQIDRLVESSSSAMSTGDKKISEEASTGKRLSSTEYSNQQDESDLDAEQFNFNENTNDEFIDVEARNENGTDNKIEY